MTLTVEGVLRLPVFSDVGVTVLAAHRNLGHPVKWVHASELPDIDKYIAGGELLLSAGIGLGRTAENQRDYVRRISRAGAVALILEESGRVFDTVPAVVVEEAEACGLPLIALDAEVPFAAVSVQVHEHFTEERLSLLIREREIDERFSELLLERADQYSLVRELSRITGKTVVLENALHQVVAGGHGSTDLESVIDDWKPHTEKCHQTESGTRCLRRLIAMRGQPWGWLHLLCGNAGATDIDSISVSRAASAVAVSLLSDRAFDLRRGQRNTALITRLLLGDISGRDFARRARELGYRLPSGDIIVVVVSRIADPETAEWTRLSYIFGDLGEYVMGVVPAANFVSTRRQVMDIIGVGRGGHSSPAPLDDIETAMKQAKTAASAAQTHAEPGLVAFDDLGIERILVSLIGTPDLTLYVRDELGPLLDWDARSSVQLTPTLRAYLEADGRKSEAAAKLFVQRRTLYNRLDRISRILCREIDAPEARMRLFLALKALELLEPAEKTPH